MKIQDTKTGVLLPSVDANLGLLIIFAGLIAAFCGTC